MFKTHVLIIKIPLSSKRQVESYNHDALHPRSLSIPFLGAEVWGPFTSL